jgi:hypothetical protein
MEKRDQAPRNGHQWFAASSLFLFASYHLTDLAIAYTVATSGLFP